MPRFVVLLLESSAASLLELRADKLNILARFAADETSTDQLTAQAVVDCLRRGGSTENSLAVLFGDDLCFPITANVEPAVARSSSALAYALEESLPFDVEDALVGIVRGVADRLAVAIRLGRFRGLVSDLKREGIRIGFLNSAGLLEFQGLTLATGRKRKFAAERLIWTRRQGDRSHLLLTESGVPVAWNSVQNGGEQGSRLAPGLMELVGRGTEHPETIELKDEQSPAPEAQIAVTTVEFARRCSAGSVRPWIEFPLEQFASTRQIQWKSPEVSIGAAVLLGLILLSAGFFVRSLQYRALTEQIESAKIELFTQAFPGQRVPLDIERAISGLRQSRLSENQAQSFGVDTSVLLCNLRDVILAIPDAGHVRFQLSSIAVEADTVGLRGDIREVSELQRIRESLEAAGLVTTFEQLRATDFSLLVRRKTAEPTP